MSHADIFALQEYTQHVLRGIHLLYTRFDISKYTYVAILKLGAIVLRQIYALEGFSKIIFNTSLFPRKPVHMWTASSYVNEFSLCPGVISNDFQRKLVAALSIHLRLINVTFKSETNVFRKIFALNCFQQEIQGWVFFRKCRLLWTTWSYVHTLLIVLQECE